MINDGNHRVNIIDLKKKYEKFFLFPEKIKLFIYQRFQTWQVIRHIKQITNVQNPMYWDSLEEGDKKTWSNYMVHRFLSMKSDWIQVVNELQKYWELAPKNVYQFYIDIIPKGRTFLKYTKSKKKSKIEKWRHGTLSRLLSM